MIVVDTGPLVALLNRRDSFHEWATTVIGSLKGPLATCEPVITEACYLMRNGGEHLVLELCERGFVITPFMLNTEWRSVRNLMKRYANVPMSLADACLVRMAELSVGARILTLDADFKIYRRNGRQVIPLITPDR